MVRVYYNILTLYLIVCNMPPKRKLQPPPHNFKITKFMKDSEAPEEKSDSQKPENSKNETDPATSVSESQVGTVKLTVRFNERWLKLYEPWLCYDSESNQMFCNLCKENKFSNNLATGTNNFRTTTLKRHVESADHRAALTSSMASQSLDTAITNLENKEEGAIMSCMKTVYWLGL